MKINLRGWDIINGYVFLKISCSLLEVDNLLLLLS